MTKRGGFLDPKVCPECGRNFYPAPMHVYVLIKGGRRNTYCSYGCWRKNGGDEPPRKRGRK